MPDDARALDLDTSPPLGAEVIDKHVVIIGAGLSGIGMAARLRQKVPHKEVAILEARPRIGGTWDLFRYPGVRSDSDMFTLGYPFRPWQEEEPIAGGDAIRHYIEETAEEYDLTRHISFDTKVTSAKWSSAACRWYVTAQTPNGEVTYRCQLLSLCTGYYDYADGYTPSFQGAEDFRGEIIHPQHWPEGEDFAGKRVAVIGSGATAITLVPALAETAEHVTMVQRSPTYVVARPQHDALSKWTNKTLPAGMARWIERWRAILMGTVTFWLSKKHPEIVKRQVRKQAVKQLPQGFDVDRHFKPDYNPWDQRVCLDPDGAFFTAVREARTSIVTDRIDRFTENGIALASGEEVKADVIVTATGLKMQLLGKIDLQVDDRPVSPPEHFVYKGMMLSDVPNMVLCFGYTNASWTLKSDLSAQAAARLLREMDERGAKVVVAPSPGPVPTEEMIDFSSSYVERARTMMPKQGTENPWKTHQNYLLDVALFKLGKAEDGVLQFGETLENALAASASTTSV